MVRKLSQVKIRPTRWFNATTVTLLVSLVVITVSISLAGGDPLILARLGSEYADGDPNGTQGYDGQFVYYIARNPDPETVAVHLDNPAYRYQRIFYPLVVRMLSLGDMVYLPWMLVLVLVISHTAGTWAVETMYKGWGINRWYALLYGLYAGFLLALVTDLPEPLAYGLVALGILAIERKRAPLGWFLFTLAVFTKEVTLLFVAAIMIADLLRRRWSNLLGMGLVVVVPFLLFQGWLWSTFGEIGIGSGGAMATPFEWIPFMGLLRIAVHSWIYLLGMLVVFIPTILWAAVWGIWKPLKSMRTGDKNMLVLALLFNSLMMVFLPFSTFRETGGLIRLACGLVLAMLLFAAFYRERRILNYCCFWLVLNVFLLR